MANGYREHQVAPDCYLGETLIGGRVGTEVPSVFGQEVWQQ